MLIELRRFYEKISQSHNLFGGRGGGGDDNGPDKDADREGKEGKEGKDPFENFDFTRFRSSRPKQPDDSTPKSSEPTGSGSSSGDDDDASNDNEPHALPGLVQPLAAAGATPLAASILIRASLAALVAAVTAAPSASYPS